MVKNIKYVVLFFLMSCSTSKVITDYDENTVFAKFKTFEFYEDNGENLNEFDVKRVEASIDQNLETAGFLQSSTPDFFIYFNTENSVAQNNNTLGIGLGSGGINGGFGISGGIPIGGKKINENLIIKFIEAKSNSLFWEGSLNSTIKEKRTPEEREFYIQKVVAEILKNYPPKNK
ncbi:DUF4136 domain-containing protein [uncultured Polaribacter sp.]|uniref:DUF4136 domain-containing protein n=1 Tax=uncultured Polaribacter sp. TaxID=174711 RepID=UPI0026047C29|nr:DUF4136 domain-containing protein [uncultured Polaribacter sp.]